MSRAVERDLASLHGALAEVFMAKLAQGEASAQELNVIRQFLKDNSISCVVEKNETMQNILELLPKFPETQEEARELKAQ